MIQLLVQLPDEDTLRTLLDAEPLRQVASNPGVHFFVIRDGQVTRHHPDAESGS